MSPPEARLPDWWRSNLSGRDVGVSAALAALVLAAGALVLGFGGRSELAGPPTRPDPVPRERLITRFPAACGVSTATINALVPRAESMHTSDFGDCEWYSRHPGDVRERRLDVTVKIWPATAGDTSAVSIGPRIAYVKTTPISNALSAFGQTAARQTVLGLGEEAFADSRRTVVDFRVANAVVTVGYQDSGLLAKKKSALDGALRAAADTAKSLGTSAGPRLGSTAPASTTRHLPDPCATVPAGLRTRLVKGATAMPDTNSCTWTSERRTLKVTLLSEPDSAPGGAVRAAIRDYLQRHYDARAEQPVSAHDRKYFHALTGPGDQAFASWVENGTPGRVVFRVRNVVVEVGYTGDADHPLTKDQAVNGAYAAAIDVARALHQ